jgi:hypothetical protein
VDSEVEAIELIQAWVSRLGLDTSVTQLMFAAHFSAFVAVALQFAMNMRLVVGRADLLKFADWATRTPPSPKVWTLPQSAQLIAQAALDMILVRKNTTGSAQATFDAIPGGSVSKDTLITYARPSIFLGTGIGTSPFYFKFSDQKAQTFSFIVRFVDRNILSVTHHDWRCFRDDCSVPRIISKWTAVPVELQTFPTLAPIGCQLIQNSIRFS